VEGAQQRNGDERAADRQFESLTRKVLSKEKKFHEFLLTRRHQGHPDLCADAAT
jgi:hypothetical protein